ncbi:MAG: hypothetical protein M3O70_12325 [Actinomycetota bacterium]|nr:hypothetical protein [Actinomycetota bacterium]
MVWDRDGWIIAHWRDLVLLGTALLLLFFFAVGLWAIFRTDDAEDITLERVEQLTQDNRRLTRELRDNQQETRELILHHRCHKEVLMDLLLEKHGVKVPADPHATLPCP